LKLIWAGGTVLLEVKGVFAGYGSVTILHGLNVTLDRGEIICVIGPNGAGKSTLLRVVAGQIHPSGGHILYDGEDLGFQTTGQRARKGLILIPQGNNIFPNLSIIENLEMAATVMKDRARAEEGALQGVLDRFPFLKQRRKMPARILSGGERQILALSRILILHPSLALIDEPSLGLAPMVVDLIFREIVNMNARGVSMLLVEQNARKALTVSHRGYVLELGRNRIEGTGKELLNSKEVEMLYLGGRG